MRPRLVAITGPLEGQTFAVAGEALAVGRHPSNDLRLPERAVSRHHFQVVPEGEGALLRDLDSRHGTFVNGVPVKERRLEHGDLLTLGASAFLFLLHETEAEPSTGGEALLVDGTAGVAETAMMRTLEEGLYTRPERVLAALPPGSRVPRALNSLLTISNAVHTLDSPAELGQRLLTEVLEVIPAHRAALLLLDRATGEVASILARRRDGSGERPFPVSRTVVEQALARGAAVLSNDLAASPALSDAESLRTAGVESLMAVPLRALQRSYGVLYLDSRDPAVRFDEGDLELVTAVGAIAGAALANAYHVERLEAENRRLQEAELAHGMVGESSAMRRLVELISRVAPSDSTVLLRGESGTGKELAARALHAGSRRSAHAFVAINCATLSPTLLESELFGHEKGAFTGATSRKEGKIEVADGGTLFLDEVGELPPELQARLLRVLQERELERVGGTRPIRVDVRLIAATNRNLEEAIRQGTFREDLFYRLNVITLELPPLRERRGDISLLAHHFAAVHGRRVRQRAMGLTREALAALTAYDWPGNVRELSNAMERAAVLGEGELIRPEDLPEAVVEAGSSREAPGDAPRYHDALTRLKKKLILEAVAASGGNITRAAEELGLHPNYLHRLITNLGLRGEVPPRSGG